MQEEKEEDAQVWILVMAISHQHIPSGGWKYFEEKTKTMLIASDWGLLVSTVTNHRKSNGIDIGDPEEDIDTQIAVNHPELVL